MARTAYTHTRTIIHDERAGEDGERERAEQKEKQWLRTNGSTADNSDLPLFGGWHGDGGVPDPSGWRTRAVGELQVKYR